MTDFWAALNETGDAVFERLKQIAKEQTMSKNDEIQFPLTSGLGIKHWHDRWCPERRECVYHMEVNDLERVLGEGVRVYGDTNSSEIGYDYKSSFGKVLRDWDTHTGLLINIKPIEKTDTAEGLLKEWLTIIQDAHIVEYTGGKVPPTWTLADFINRAKKLVSL